MSIWSDVTSLALRPLLPKIADAVADAAGGPVAGVAVNAVKNYLVTRFSDPSRKLPKALTQASDRAWRALEVAVAGESLWSKMKRHGEDKAFSVAVRAFLSTNPLALAAHQDAAFRRRACEQFQAARQAGVIPGAPVSGTVLANAAADLTRFADAPAQCAAEWQVVATIANDLRRGGYVALADLLDLRTDPAQPPLLAVAVRFFFRREIETNEEMFRGLVYEQVDNLRQDMRDGLSGLMAVLETHEGWLAGLLAVAEETRDRVLEVQQEMSRVNEKLDRLLDREMRPGDSMSIRNDTERRLTRAVIAKYRALSEDDRRSAPDLLEAVARLEHAAGDLGDAQRDFQERAALPGDTATKARAHYGAYLTAIERKHYGTALTELQEAVRLAPEQYSPFPLNKYVPERILGAGGFGVVALCRDVDSGARVAVKALRTEELDRDAATVLAEAEQLETLEHENIIRLRTAGFADAARTRPYLVMSFFEGTTLDEYVLKNGPLPSEEARVLAGLIAAGLQAAHVRDILHRDVKPANILVRKVNGCWQLKLIDFGLALRRQAVHNTISNVEALQLTTFGKSVAGTLDYAAPEQMGKIRGAKPGPESDVFSFGKTICFLLFKNPQPGPDDWDSLTDGALKKMLAGCLKHDPAMRIKTLAEVRQLLQVVPVALGDVETVDWVVALEEGEEEIKPAPKAMTRPKKTDAINPKTLESLVAKVKRISGIKLMSIQDGSFLMGSVRDDIDADDDEKPQHKVTISKPFYISKYKVTVGQFKRFMQANPLFKTEAEKDGDKHTWKNPGFAQTDEHPVVYVSWNDADAYCRWLAKETGANVRLPHEAEWEYCCRAVSEAKPTTKFCFGDNETDLGNYAWYTKNTNDEGTQPCGLKAPNAFDIYDMHGLAWEWCSDGKREYPITGSELTDPKGATADGVSRVIRGGSFNDAPRICRAAYRDVNAPSNRYGNFGFRVSVSR